MATKKARPPETRIVRAIINWLNSHDRVKAVKVHGGPYQQAGIPDIDCVWRGRAVRLEVKRQTTRKAPPVTDTSKGSFEQRGATPLQAKSLQEYKEAGAIVGVVTSIEETSALLRQEGLLDEHAPDA